MKNKIPKHISFIFDSPLERASEAGMVTNILEERMSSVIKILRFCEENNGYIVSIFFLPARFWMHFSEGDEILVWLKGEISKLFTKLEPLEIQVKYLGYMPGLPSEIRADMMKEIEDTRNAGNLVFYLSINYGDHSEITQAIKLIIKDGKRVEEVDEDTVARYVYPRDIMPPELVILMNDVGSNFNFFFWKGKNSIIYENYKKHDEFTEEDLWRAIDVYSSQN